MKIFRTDDPAADFSALDAEQTAWLRKRPVCCWCSQPIQDEHYWDINGFAYCEDCAESQFRKFTEDYIE